MTNIWAVGESPVVPNRPTTSGADQALKASVGESAVVDLRRAWRSLNSHSGFCSATGRRWPLDEGVVRRQVRQLRLINSMLRGTTIPPLGLYGATTHLVPPRSHKH